MRRLPVLLLAVAVWPLMAAAQSTPVWELSTGYQFTRVPLGGVQNAANNVTGPADLPSVDVGSLNMNGGDLEIEENVRSWVGGVFDMSGSYALKRIDVTNVAVAAGLVSPGTHVQAEFNPLLLTFAGGPQFHYRKHEHFQPFARILLGLAHADLSPNPPTQAVLNELGPPAFDTTRNSFVGIAGIGTDYVWKQNLAFRVGADFVRTYLFSGCPSSSNSSTTTCSFPDEHQSNVRITAGVDFRFGQK